MTRDRRPGIFLDKDGTLIPDLPYNVDPARIVLCDGAGELRALKAHGFRIVVVSNQSGVARGIFPESALAPVELRLRELLGAIGVELDGFYYCPHHPDGVVAAYVRVCVCRKPAAGMLMRAGYELDLDLSRSWMVGDILDDVAAGNAAGCQTVFLDIGHEDQWVSGPGRTPSVTAGSLGGALAVIGRLSAELDGAASLD